MKNQNEKAESLKDLEIKPRAEKISEEHLKQMQSLVNAINSMQFNLGRVEMSKHDLLHKISAAQDRISLFQDTLRKEYGTFDINIEDGSINWPEENKNEK